MHSSRILLLLLGGTILVSSLSAQTSIEIGPSIGIFLPLGSYEGPAPSEFPPFTARATWTQSNALAIGAHADVWLGQRWGLTTTFHYAGSSVERSAANTPQGRIEGSLQVLTAEFLVRLGDEDRAFRLQVSGGIASITRSGKAYEQVDDQNAIGGLLGVGSRRNLGSRWVLSGNVRLLIYSLALRDQTTSYKSSTQADILGQVGLSYRVF